MEIGQTYSPEEVVAVLTRAAIDAGLVYENELMDPITPILVTEIMSGATVIGGDGASLISTGVKLSAVTTSVTTSPTGLLGAITVAILAAALRGLVIKAAPYLTKRYGTRSYGTLFNWVLLLASAANLGDFAAMLFNEKLRSQKVYAVYLGKRLLGKMEAEAIELVYQSGRRNIQRALRWRRL